MDRFILIFILSCGLILLQIIWLLTDPRSLRERYANVIQKSYLLVTVISLLQVFSALFYPAPNYPLDFIIIPLGIIFYVAGIMLDIWAKLTMKQYWGPPAQHDTKRQKKLITKGPFKFSRNPIYVGIILTILGYGLAIHSFLVIFVYVLYRYFYEATLKEEKLLEKAFGKDYLYYKQKTPRFLLFK